MVYTSSGRVGPVNLIDVFAILLYFEKRRERGGLVSEIDEKLLYEIVGARLRDAREQHRPRLTQTALGEALGLERTSISNIEAGKQRPPLHVLYKLCDLLRLDINSLLPPVEEIEAESQQHGGAREEEIQVGSKSQFVPPKTSAFIQRQTQPSRHLPEKAAALVEEFKRAHGEKE